jgi:uncharacterized membrane protein YccC
VVQEFRKGAISAVLYDRAIGASISAVIAVFVVLLTAYLERRRKSHSDSADRLAEYLASTHDGEVAISDLARAAEGDKNKAREDVRSHRAWRTGIP